MSIPSEHYQPEASASMRRGILISMCLALVLVVASVTALTLSLPDLAVSIGASNTQLTWIVDAYTVALAATVLPLGAIGDRYGRLHVLMLDTVVFGVASLVASQMTSPDALIAARAVMGLGAAMIMPGTLSTITAAFPEAERNRGVAVWAGFASGGAILGLLAAGLLLEQWAWESIFVFTAIVAAVSCVLAFVLAPNTQDDKHEGLDLIGSLLSALGIGALVFGIIEGGEKGWTHVEPAAGFIAAAILIGLFVIWELRQSTPLLDPRLFRLRGFSAGTIAVLSQFLALFGCFFVGLQYLQLVPGYSALRSALAMTPVALVILPMSVVTPRIVERVGARLVISSGVVTLAAGLFIFSRLDVGSSYWHFLAGLIVAGLGVSWTGTPATTIITGSLPRAKQGVASAINDTTREVGAALGIAIMGSIYASTYADKIAPVLPNVPTEAAGLVEKSAAGGLYVASQAGPQGPVLALAVKDAFIAGMSDSFTAVVGFLVVVAIVIFTLIPQKLKNAPNEPDVSRMR